MHDARALFLWHILNFVAGKLFASVIVLTLPFHIALGELRNRSILSWGTHDNLDYLLPLLCGLGWAAIGWVRARNVLLPPEKWKRAVRTLRVTTAANVIVVICIVAVTLGRIPSGVLLVYPLLLVAPLLISVPVTSAILREAK